MLCSAALHHFLRNFSYISIFMSSHVVVVLPQQNPIRAQICCIIIKTHSRFQTQKSRSLCYLHIFVPKFISFKQNYAIGCCKQRSNENRFNITNHKRFEDAVIGTLHMPPRSDSARRHTKRKKKNKNYNYVYTLFTCRDVNPTEIKHM